MLLGSSVSLKHKKIPQSTQSRVFFPSTIQLEGLTTSPAYICSFFLRAQVSLILRMWMVHSTSPPPMDMRSSPVAHHGEGVTTSTLAPVATWNGFSGQKWLCWPCCLLVLIFDNLQNLQLVGSLACGAGTCQCPRDKHGKVSEFREWEARFWGMSSSLRNCPLPAQWVGVAVSQAAQ